MKYRKFGSNGENVSVLGFGGLRFPGYEHDSAHIDVEKAVDMLLYAFDLGINYVDTAYLYRGGESEVVIGKAIKKTDKRVLTATKFPLVNNPKSGAYTRILEESLTRMDLPFIDYYHFHGISKDTFDTIIVPQGFLKEAIKAKEQGLIRHISFSFHDKPEAMRHIIDYAEIMETVLCQYNIIDRRNEDAMVYAKSKGLGVAVMGPLAGGKFVVPDELLNSQQFIKLNSTADIALRFVLNNPNVDMVLSGMRNRDMVAQNVRIAEVDTPFTPDETIFLERMIDENKVIADCYCTECCYCLPCPVGINIPYVFRLLNFHKVDGITEYARSKFRQIEENTEATVSFLNADVSVGTSPSKCIGCGKCVRKCPQNLNIPEKLKEAIKILKED